METVRQWWQQLNGNQDWIMQVFFVVFVTLLANYLAKKFYDLAVEAGQGNEGTQALYKVFESMSSVKN